MGDDNFRITFNGEILQGWDPEEVKANMARLFKLNTDNEKNLKVLEKMFSGKQVIIKAGLEKDTALAYLDAITDAGGEAYIDPRDVPPAGISERRVAQRRRYGDRRKTSRPSSILPDRRSCTGRRNGDTQTEN